MSQDRNKSDDISQLFGNWMDVTRMFWQDYNNQSELFSSGATQEKRSQRMDEDDGRFKTYKTWETSANNYLSILNLLLLPENRDDVLRGFSSVSESMFQSMGDSLENISDLQGQVVQTLIKVADHTKAYNLDDLDHTAFEAYRDLYRDELQKYLNIPKIGLPREFQEQIAQLIDKSNVFSSHLVELVFLFTIPFEKTHRAMQENMKEMLEKGEFQDDVNRSYQDWVRILEKHFMELLKSPDYTKVLNETIVSLADYKGVRNDVTNVFLKELQIPTNQDMDEVYKDLYLMKKKISSLTKEVASLRQELDRAARN